RLTVEVAAHLLPVQELPPLRNGRRRRFWHDTASCSLRYVEWPSRSEHALTRGWIWSESHDKGVVLKGAPDSTMAPSGPRAGSLEWTCGAALARRRPGGGSPRRPAAARAAHMGTLVCTGRRVARPHSLRQRTGSDSRNRGARSLPLRSVVPPPSWLPQTVPGPL